MARVIESDLSFLQKLGIEHSPSLSAVALKAQQIFKRGISTGDDRYVEVNGDGMTVPNNEHAVAIELIVSKLKKQKSVKTVQGYRPTNVIPMRA